MEDWIMAVLFNRPKDRMKNTFYEWILVFLCIYICSIGFSESAASRGKCQHGTFTNGTCVCISGWGDKNCDKCYGRARLSKDEGFITDGQGNYSLATKCSWLIDIPEANQTVWFKFYEFATECGWDHLYIHDGDSSFSPVLAAFSGLILTRNNNSDVGFAASVSSKHMYIHFSSDAAYTMAGFNISYSVTGCYLGCSDHGICDNNICKCNEGFTGQGCETTVCPNNCSSNGDCIGDVCKCKPEYKGDDCSISESEALWEIVKTELSPGGRASHVAITENDLMWVVGGYTLTPFSTRNIHRYNFIQKKWSKVREQGPSIPPPRYAHASDLHDNKLYMYGGVVDGRVMNDMWVYNIINTNWTQLTSSPYNVSGHTAHIVDGIMYVFFGYSPKYGYMRIVQEYDIANDKWSVPITDGAIVHGGYSHSSVIHVDSSGVTCIYIYGGYHSDTQSGYNLTDKLYMYNSRTKTWTVLRSSGSPRYLHSAVVLDGIILIFGGNTHNDTSVSKGAKCYSTDFMAYDIECNSWHFLPQPNLSQNIARYGQSMVEHQGFVYMYGGFNGRMLKDLIKFSPGKCIAIKDKDVCSQSFPGTKCVWFQRHCATRSHLKTSYIPNCDPSKGGEKICKGYNSCTSCNNTSYDCKWCNNGCFYKNCSTDDSNPPGNCSQSHPCNLHHNCYSCIKEDKCRWTNKCMDKIKMINLQGDEVTEDSKIENVKTGSIKDNFEQCELPCSMYTTCENCTGKTCMWCSNMKQCVGTNSYVVSFPYGQCTDWTTKDEKCPATRCSGLRSCGECQANSVCGWCNDPSNTGLGRCMEGGDTGPVDNSHLTNNSFCPADRWYFTACPDCQCNGHSTCHENTSICEMCQDLTEGPHCEYCQTGYFGNPRNGGNCSVCECNEQADLCDRESGKCHCRTRGVTGDKCDTCDKTHSYVGDPTSGGTCYYQLVTDYQFTFNLSKAEDKYLTQINFMNIPSANDRDVDFTLNCSGLAFINITYKSKSQPEEQYVVSGHECDLFRTKFEHKDYNFGGEENTTFLVYVYGYKTPFWLVISFSQFPKIDLIHFFVTFFSCFLSLLLIAAALWKIKHKYDSYRRRQQHIVEMQQMASRPFASVTVEIGIKPKDKMLESLLGKEVKDVMDSHTTRKRKKFGPGAIAIEPLNTYKAAILSLVIQLPNGDEDFVPDGLTGVAVASTLVTLGNTRKQSVEHIRGDKSKLRKHLQHTHPETCA